MRDQADPSDDVFRHVEPIFHDAAFIRDLGITLTAAGPGWCETALVVHDRHLQQHGFAHAGVITTLADHTAGGAARASVPPGQDVLTISVEMHLATSVRSSGGPANTSDSATAIRLPQRSVRPRAISRRSVAGRRKLILNSIVRTSWPGGTDARAAPPAV